MCRVRVIIARCGTLTGFASSVIDITRGGVPRTRALPRAIIFNAFSVNSSDEDHDRGCYDVRLNVQSEEEVDVPCVLCVRVS